MVRDKKGRAAVSGFEDWLMSDFWHFLLAMSIPAALVGFICWLADAHDRQCARERHRGHNIETRHGEYWAWEYNVIMKHAEYKYHPAYTSTR